MKLFEPCSMGNLQLKNRVFMAPLTRNRADDDTDVPGELAIEYYQQRASAGLIVTEATQISPEGKGYIATPGIYNEEQVERWRQVTDAVHKRNGKIVVQLWHVGRISHVSLQPDQQQPLAPSAVRADTQTFTHNGFEDVSEPRAMTSEDIKKTIDDYRNAARLAKQAGFDGIEVHGANGYLINQFICDKTNQRSDEYGGDIENRARFLFEVLDAVLEEWDAGNVGLRLSPTGKFNDVDDSDPSNTFHYIIEKLNQYQLAYLHIVEQFPGVPVDNADYKLLIDLLGRWDGFYIANGDYDLLTASAAVDSGRADAITFGRLFISNPDLPERLEKGVSLNEPDQDTFYGGGAEGYTDYPFLSDR